MLTTTKDYLLSANAELISACLLITIATATFAPTVVHAESPQAYPTAAQITALNTRLANLPSKDLIPRTSCSTATGPLRSPDNFEPLLNSRKRYRLVIGASTNLDAAENRDFVAATAAVIDARLAALHFDPVPNVLLSAPRAPYLIGTDVTKANVMSVLTSLGQVMAENDIAIVYYAGHSSIPARVNDLMLAVHDRPVAVDEGISLGDALATLMFHKYRKGADAISKIPRIIFVLDSCYSGNAAPNLLSVAEVNGMQQVYIAAGTPTLPQQMVLITSTVASADARSFPHSNSPLTAFGTYFARALDEDWTCADTNLDGIITGTELVNFLTVSLKIASDAGDVEQRMTPTGLHNDSFVAYSGTHYFNEGERAAITLIQLDVPYGKAAIVTLPSGHQQKCAASDCLLAFDKSAKGSLDVSVADASRSTLLSFDDIPHDEFQIAIKSIPATGKAMAVNGLQITKLQ